MLSEASLDSIGAEAEYAAPLCCATDSRGGDGQVGSRQKSDTCVALLYGRKKEVWHLRHT